MQVIYPSLAQTAHVVQPRGDKRAVLPVSLSSQARLLRLHPAPLLAAINYQSTTSQQPSYATLEAPRYSIHPTSPCRTSRGKSFLGFLSWPDTACRPPCRPSQTSSSHQKPGLPGAASVERSPAFSNLGSLTVTSVSRRSC